MVICLLPYFIVFKSLSIVVCMVVCLPLYFAVFQSWSAIACYIKFGLSWYSCQFATMLFCVFVFICYGKHILLYSNLWLLWYTFYRVWSQTLSAMVRALWSFIYCGSVIDLLLCFKVFWSLFTVASIFNCDLVFVCYGLHFIKFNLTYCSY